MVMRCMACGKDIEGKWRFCPSCGARVLEKDMFSEVFERVEHEMKQMGRTFERDFEVLDISPFFRKPNRGGGFSIKISSSGREKPKVSFKTFGNVDRREVEDKIGKLGFKGTGPTEPAGEEGRVHLEKAKTTEEPKTDVRRTNGSILVKVNLPGVKDMGDIEVKALENSIEVKAVAGERAYFKILTKPENANIVRKDFENGVLRIELV